MRYRDARLLQPGDMVIRKSDKLLLTVVSIEAYGQHKLVKIFYTDTNSQLSSILSNEVE